MMKLLSRIRKRDESGLTLIEAIVSMFIFSLISVIIFNVFQTTNQTANAVQTGTTSIGSSQIATQQISREVRNAVLLNVTSDGRRLSVQKIDGSCMSWVFFQGGLYTHSGSSGPAFVNTWFKRITGATLINNKSFFTARPEGVSYSFNHGSGVGAVSLKGDAFMRVPGNAATSVCFGPGVGGPVPTPTPTPTPTPPPAATIYSILYNLDGGAVAGNPVSYTNETGAITLINPTRSGFNFAGWTGTGLSSTTATVVIPAGSTGNRTYTSTWTAIPAPTPTPTPTPTPPASQLTAIITSNNGWGKTYAFDITITNNGPAINNGWSVAWTSPNANKITAWNAICTRTGSNISCLNQSYNTSIPAGGTLAFAGQVVGSGATLPPGIVVTAAPR